MDKKTKLIFCAIICFLVGNTQTVFSQEGSSELPSLMDGDVYVWNSNQTTNVNFTIWSPSCDEADFYLEPDYYGTYSCGDDTEIYIRIITEHSNGQKIKVEYSLSVLQRYEVYYNTSRSAWDVRQLAR